MCFNCGEPGHFASQCGTPKNENPEKGTGKGVGKKGKGVNNLADILKAAGLQMSTAGDTKPTSGQFNLIRPMCCLTKARHERNETGDHVIDPLAYPVPSAPDCFFLA